MPSRNIRKNSSKYYRLDNILKYKALYNVIFGGRNNGKTFAVHEYGLKNYLETGKQMAIIRRWSDDFTGARGQSFFNNQVSSGNVERLSEGRWTDITYYASKWYLCCYNPDTGERIRDDKPFAYGFSISAMEHDKSTAYPDITVVCFDEFLTRTIYLDNEFVLFMNVLSTIIRHRTDVTIFMLGNTVSKFCPYFTEMGLKHVKDMKPGTIDLYRYGNEQLTVAVEFTDQKVSKENEAYFAFDNPKLSMITGNIWEIDIYPHCPAKYKPKDIVFTYFIQYDQELLQADIIVLPEQTFTFIHRKTTPIKDPDKDIIYTPEFNSMPNYRRKITKPMSKQEQAIADYYRKDKVFFQDNEVGEIVRAYLQFCGKAV